MTRGYLGRPGATAEAFVPDPWSTQPGDRAYRTGDLARWLLDQGIESMSLNPDTVVETWLFLAGESV